MQPGDLLLRPPVLIALAVVLLNDRVLKASYGNVLTGKLSDVAGVFVLPLVMVSAVELARWALKRPAWPASRTEVVWAIAITAIGFAAVKMIGPIGDAYAEAVGMLRAGIASLVHWELRPVVPIEVIRDWSDVLVLPVLAGTWLCARTRNEGAASRRAAT
ncbi:MAG: hypothetical protein KDB24_03865 [Microthrixaceae bacterium]|nr:hypothetical protein [Microthrixaceae bacterium]